MKHINAGKPRTHAVLSWGLALTLLSGCATAPELLKDTWEIVMVRSQRIDTTMSLTKRPTQREDTVQFSPLMTSKMACPDRDNVVLEERILDAFRNAFRARRSGQTLEFLDARDSVLMSCIGIPNEEQPVPAQELPR